VRQPATTAVCRVARTVQSLSRFAVVRSLWGRPQTLRRPSSAQKGIRPVRQPATTVCRVARTFQSLSRLAVVRSL
jgi:hypothetical protein